jgi:hypothetical protein
VPFNATAVDRSHRHGLLNVAPCLELPSRLINQHTHNRLRQQHTAHAHNSRRIREHVHTARRPRRRARSRCTRQSIHPRRRWTRARERRPYGYEYRAPGTASLHAWRLPRCEPRRSCSRKHHHHHNTTRQSLHPRKHTRPRESFVSPILFLTMRPGCGQWADASSPNATSRRPLHTVGW